MTQVAIDYLKTIYPEEITKEQFYRICHISKRTALYLLKKRTKIADISEDVGFGLIRSFNHAFLDVMEMTPKKFRLTYRNQKDFK